MQLWPFFCTLDIVASPVPYRDSIPICLKARKYRACVRRHVVQLDSLGYTWLRLIHGEREHLDSSANSLVAFPLARPLSTQLGKPLLAALGLGTLRASQNKTKMTREGINHGEHTP